MLRCSCAERCGIAGCDLQLGPFAGRGGVGGLNYVSLGVDPYKRLLKGLSLSVDSQLRANPPTRSPLGVSMASPDHRHRLALTAGTSYGLRHSFAARAAAGIGRVILWLLSRFTLRGLRALDHVFLFFQSVRLWISSGYWQPRP